MHHDNADESANVGDERSDGIAISVAVCVTVSESVCESKCVADDVADDVAINFAADGRSNSESYDGADASYARSKHGTLCGAVERRTVSKSQ